MRFSSEVNNAISQPPNKPAPVVSPPMVTRPRGGRAGLPVDVAQPSGGVMKSRRTPLVLNHQHLVNNGIGVTCQRSEGGAAGAAGAAGVAGAAGAQAGRGRKGDIMAARSRCGGQVQIRPAEIRARVQLTFALLKGSAECNFQNGRFLHHLRWFKASELVLVFLRTWD